MHTPGMEQMVVENSCRALGSQPRQLRRGMRLPVTCTRLRGRLRRFNYPRLRLRKCRKAPRRAHHLRGQLSSRELVVSASSRCVQPRVVGAICISGREGEGVRQLRKAGHKAGRCWVGAWGQSPPRYAPLSLDCSLAPEPFVVRQAAAVMRSPVIDAKPSAPFRPIFPRHQQTPDPPDLQSPVTDSINAPSLLRRKGPCRKGP
jgi:hypothetical protein